MADTAGRDPNRVTTTLALSNANDGVDIALWADPSTHRLLTTGTITSGFGIGAYDYVSLAVASTTDTYTFKTGGAGGSTVATITITYTDSGKGTISTVVKT